METLTERVERLEQITRTLGLDTGPDQDFNDQFSKCEDSVISRSIGRRGYSETAGLMPEQVDRRLRDKISAEGPALEEILKRVYDLGQHADVLGIKLQSVGDRAFGPRPEEAGSGGVEARPEAVLDQINIALSYVANRLHRIEDEANRLSRL
jgi:hypothetical protein